MYKRLAATEIWFYRMILRIASTEHVSNNEVLGKRDTYTQYPNDIVEGSRKVNE